MGNRHVDALFFNFINMIIERSVPCHGMEKREKFFCMRTRVVRKNHASAVNAGDRKEAEVDGSLTQKVFDCTEHAVAAAV